jgi:hypothetical protein
MILTPPGGEFSTENNVGNNVVGALYIGAQHYSLPYNFAMLQKNVAIDNILDSNKPGARAKEELHAQTPNFLRA